MLFLLVFEILSAKTQRCSDVVETVTSETWLKCRDETETLS